jgi:ACT domain-containing protein
VSLTEEEIRQITLTAIEELGEKASPALVKNVVQKTIENAGHPVAQSEKQGRIILTSFGYNNPGVVAAITKVLSDTQCDIHDISQKIMHEFYTMIMIVDITNSQKELKDLQEEMYKVADKLQIKIYLQHEDLFTQMHRI